MILRPSFKEWIVLIHSVLIPRFTSMKKTYSGSHT